jgi:prevent-host-death family protein
MESVTALEAKTRFGELLERVMNGEEVIITRHDKPVARMVPQGSASAEARRRAGETLFAIQERTKAYAGDRAPKDWETFKKWASEGRK